MMRFALMTLLALIAPLAARAETKTIALTFDDVPRAAGAFLTPAERQRRLIAALAAAGVKAAFFTNPGNVAGDRRGARAVTAYAAAGHVIANHSWSHPALSDTPTATYLADVDRAAAWLRGRPGARAWYRFPYLDEGGNDMAKRDAVRAAFATRGIMSAPITVDAWDWNLEERALDAKTKGQAVDRAALVALFVRSYVDAAAQADRFARKIFGRPVAQVVLMHEADVTTLGLPALIKALRADGWTIVSPAVAYQDPIYKIPPSSLPAEGPLLDALAGERGVTRPGGLEYNDAKTSNALFDAAALKK